MTGPNVYLRDLHAVLSFISEQLASHFHLLTNPKREEQLKALTTAIYLTSSASSPQFLSRDSRLQSFQNAEWTRNSQLVHDLVNSGFFCTGYADHVKCFFCDLELRGWDHPDRGWSGIEQAEATCKILCHPCWHGLGFPRGPRPTNYKSETSNLGQDGNNELIRLLHEEMQKPYARVTCGLGFPDTQVLLCIARKFIRLRQTYDVQSLVAELQSEWDRQILSTSDWPKFDLASVLNVLCSQMVPE